MSWLANPSQRSCISLKSYQKYVQINQNDILEFYRLYLRVTPLTLLKDQAYLCIVKRHQLEMMNKIKRG